MNTIEFNNVSKKFKKGERFNSLRDSIPNFFRGLSAGAKKDSTLDSKEFWAVKDVNFHVQKGEVVGIIGPNGAGKSTILKLLSRIMNPTKGSLHIHGRLSALIEVTAGFHPELTGRENVYLNGTILGMKKKEIDAKFDEIVEFSGIKEFIDTPVKRYSSGMYSRLGFSVAAHIDPDVLLVDEVLAVGDIAFQSKCAEKMRELFRSGVTIVLVSHNIPLIENLCQRVILLNKGQVQKEGSVHDVIPFYENIVFKQREDELRHKIGASDGRVKVDSQKDLAIREVSLLNGAGKQPESFSVGEDFKVKIQYDAAREVKAPVFSIEIIRADGVLCCSSNTKGDAALSGQVSGSGAAQVHFGKLNLGPGIYAVKASVWDRDMIHPYDIRKDGVFRVDVSREQKHDEAVFLQPMTWEIRDSA